jgi:hypothetical protein
MIWLRLILAVLGWSGALLLELLLMRIAQFFEQNSGQPTGYRLHLIPIVLTMYGAGRYILRIKRASDVWPDFTGDPIANLALGIGGIILILLGGRLYEAMMGAQDVS